MASGQPTRERPRTAIVTGDVTFDWNLPRLVQRDFGETWNDPGKRFDAVGCAGGAALLGHILSAVKPRRSWKVLAPSADDTCDQLFTIWSFSPPASGAAKGAWRVAEVLGTKNGAPGRQPWHPRGGSTADLLVIDDKARGFRGEDAHWQPLLGSLSPEAWIIWRVGRPLGDTRLWKELTDKHSERLIAVTTASDVRQAEVHVSRELSWESTALDLYRELTGRSAINTLSQCAYTIVCFDNAGALVLPAHPREGTPPNPCQLTFDPLTMEGDQRRHDRGYVSGNTYCVVAALARALMDMIAEGKAPAANRIVDAVVHGLDCARMLHAYGYEFEDQGLAFPTRKLAQFLSAPRPPDKRPRVNWVRVDLPVLRGSGAALTNTWTILATAAEDLEEVARDIAVRGVNCVQDRIPVLRFNRYAVLDRREIEGCRNIQRLIIEYDQGRRSNPLSLAVFGPPGSGKSFGITEMARTIFARESVEVLTFNLSQFSGPEDVRGAFHQVRDVRLRGKLPLVFWDEFDCTVMGHELGWLAFFLAPMQDGTFQDGQITHPIGKSVFVFAGGTSTSYSDFEAKAGSHAQAKGPDFTSRLLGYMDVIGINPLESVDHDRIYAIRRAVLLNALLEKHCPYLRGPNGFDIDEGLLTALLHIPEYKHGARSMEAIIAMSTLADRTRFERSCLPSESQLHLHVDGREFRHLIFQGAA